MKNVKIDRTLFSPKINDVFSTLEKSGIKLNELHVLEMFGRDGTAHVIEYAKKIKKLEVWEIDDKWEGDLKKNLPDAEIKIHDSVEMLNNGNNLSKYDMVIIDNTIPMFGPKDEPNKYCEHFDFIKNIGRVINQNGIIIFNVNKKPFNYHKQTEWQKRRGDFYGSLDTSNLSIEFLLNFYKEMFLNCGFLTIFSYNVSRHKPHLDYLIFYLQRINQDRNIGKVDWISLHPLFKRLKIKFDN